MVLFWEPRMWAPQPPRNNKRKRAGGHHSLCLRILETLRVFPHCWVSNYFQQVSCNLSLPFLTFPPSYPTKWYTAHSKKHMKDRKDLIWDVREKLFLSLPPIHLRLLCWHLLFVSSMSWTQLQAETFLRRKELWLRYTCHIFACLLSWLFRAFKSTHWKRNNCFNQQ